MHCYFVELKRHFLSYFFDWLSYTPVPLMERVVTRCQRSPAQWTYVTNTFGALILFELHITHIPSNSNSYSASKVLAGIDAA